MLNQTINRRYRIVALLGEGAMGEVYRAFDTKVGHDVAVKVITQKLASSTDMLERFRREGEALRQLRHRHIVAFVDMFPLGKQYVIVMEYVPGGSLHGLIKRGPLPIARAVRIALELSDALACAHHIDIVHRDIKPENVLIAGDGTPKLTDFGVARLVSENVRLTGTGTQIGTPFYMSPEAWEGKPLDAQADVWSLGIVLYEMLAGQVPFGGTTLVAVMNKVLTAPLPDIKTLRPDIPPALAEAVQRMLTRDKAERYRTMRQVAVDLEEIEDDAKRALRGQEENARRKAEAEQKARTLRAQAEAKRKQEEEAQRKAEGEQKAQALRAQEGARRKAEAEQKARALQAQEEAKRNQEEARLKVEEELKAKALAHQEASDDASTVILAPEEKDGGQPVTVKNALPKLALGGALTLVIVGLLIIGGLGVWVLGGKFLAPAPTAAQTTPVLEKSATQTAQAGANQTALAVAAAITRTPTPSQTSAPTIPPSPTYTQPPTDTPSPTDTPVPSDTPEPTFTDTLGPPTSTPVLGIGSTQVSPADGMVQVYVPAGNFLMGSTNAEVNQTMTEVAPCPNCFNQEKPRHSVYLDAYWIDRTDVTNAMYAQCVQAGKCQQPSDKSSKTRPNYYGNAQYDRYPVIFVSWNDAKAYCSWAGRRLPTEAEWEKAARGTNGQIYPWGNQAPDATLANFYGNVGDTTEVGKYLAGASPYGALDMAGNVWQWVNDWYSDTYYSISPDKNPAGPTSGQSRGLRGGAWNEDLSNRRTAYRYRYNPAYRHYYIGFRCVRSP